MDPAKCTLRQCILAVHRIRQIILLDTVEIHFMIQLSEELLQCFQIRHAFTIRSSLRVHHESALHDLIAPIRQNSHRLFFIVLRLRLIFPCIIKAECPIIDVLLLEIGSHRCQRLYDHPAVIHDFCPFPDLLLDFEHFNGVYRKGCHGLEAIGRTLILQTSGDTTERFIARSVVIQKEASSNRDRDRNGFQQFPIGDEGRRLRLFFCLLMLFLHTCTVACIGYAVFQLAAASRFLENESLLHQPLRDIHSLPRSPFRP